MKPDGFDYFAEFLTSGEQSELLSRVQGLTFTHDTFRGQKLKRGYAQLDSRTSPRARKSFPPIRGRTSSRNWRRKRRGIVPTS